MSGWRACSLSDVCDVIMGQAPPGEAYNDKEIGYPLIAGAGDFDGERPAAKKWTSIAPRLSRPGDIVLGIRASIGEAVRADRIYCLGRGVAALRPRKGVRVDFLWHWLSQIQPELAHRGRGATFKQVTGEDISTLPISLPSVEEQHRIAAILDQADALRAKRRAALAQLDEMARAIFVEMFGDPERNSKGWPLIPFRDACRNDDARRVPVKLSDRAGRQGKFPYYGASGIIDWVDSFLFDGERLLIAEDGANLVSRSTPIAFIANGQFWVNNHAHVLAANGRASLRYVESFFNLTDLKPYVSGSAQPKLTQAALDRIPFPNPPMELQQQFEARLSALAQVRVDADAHSKSADSLFTSLQHRAFRGEL